MSSETPQTPELSETELRGMKVGELHDRDRGEGMAASSAKPKEELVDAISAAHPYLADEKWKPAGQATGAAADAGPDDGRAHVGE